MNQPTEAQFDTASSREKSAPREGESVGAGSTGGRKRKPRRRMFHVGMSIAFLATAVAGFGPTFYLKGLTDAPPLSPLLHVHAVVFTAWLVLLLVQSGLIARRRVGVHRRLGIAGAALGAVMIPLGAMTAIESARRGVTRPGLDPLEFLVFPLGALVLFVGFMGAALWLRRKPELHRRLVVLATVSIMTPAIARLPVVGGRPVVALLLSLLFVAAAAIHDWRARGRVHPIYLWGSVLILVSGPARFGVGQTAAWQALARFLTH